jgi:predicted small integral membrane protein
LERHARRSAAPAIAEEGTIMTTFRMPERARTARLGDALASLGTLPFAVSLLVALNGLYIALVALGNITDFGANQALVQHVLAMDTTNFGGPPGTGLDPRVMWRAITDPALQNAAYVGVIAWETLTAVVLGAATVRCVRDRGTSQRTAYALSTVGLVMIIALFFGGFIVIGGEWFQMWRSTAWNGLDPAFRNTVLAMITLVLLNLAVRPESAIRARR